MITIAKQAKYTRMRKSASTWGCNARRQKKIQFYLLAQARLSGKHAKGMGKIECARTQRASKPGVPLHIPLLVHHHVLTSRARFFP